MHDAWLVLAPVPGDQHAGKEAGEESEEDVAEHRGNALYGFQRKVSAGPVGSAPFGHVGTPRVATLKR